MSEQTSQATLVAHGDRPRTGGADRKAVDVAVGVLMQACLLYTSPSPRDS